MISLSGDWTSLFAEKQVENPVKDSIKECHFGWWGCGAGLHNGDGWYSCGLGDIQRLFSCAVSGFSQEVRALLFPDQQSSSLQYRNRSLPVAFCHVWQGCSAFADLLAVYRCIKVSVTQAFELFARELQFRTYAADVFAGPRRQFSLVVTLQRPVCSTGFEKSVMSISTKVSVFDQCVDSSRDKSTASPVIPLLMSFFRFCDRNIKVCLGKANRLDIAKWWLVIEGHVKNPKKNSNRFCRFYITNVMRGVMA